jgi:hypothetical protein
MCHKHSLTEKRNEEAKKRAMKKVKDIKDAEN